MVFEKMYSQYVPRMKVQMHFQAFSTVGTPDYIAPEVLLKKGYGVECDWYVEELKFTCLELSLFSTKLISYF
jgi:protein-serine/threonine kinase